MRWLDVLGRVVLLVLRAALGALAIVVLAMFVGVHL
jgi:hypothetical protein